MFASVGKLPTNCVTTGISGVADGCTVIVDPFGKINKLVARLIASSTERASLDLLLLWFTTCSSILALNAAMIACLFSKLMVDSAIK